MGFLKPEADCADGMLRLEELYIPRPGDMIFFWSGGPLKKALYRLFFVGPPSHVGMVVLLPDGHPALLESTIDTNYGIWGVGLSDIPSRLAIYPGAIWVRRLRIPLTAEQSCCLTAFAVEQQGKPFAISHLLFPPLALPCNGPLLIKLGGHACLKRRCWFCSGLVAASAIAAGLLDGRVVRPGFTDPRDLFVDRFLDLSPTWEKPVSWVRDIVPSRCSKQP